MYVCVYMYIYTHTQIYTYKYMHASAILNGMAKTRGMEPLSCIEKRSAEYPPEPALFP